MAHSPKRKLAVARTGPSLMPDPAVKVNADGSIQVDVSRIPSPDRVYDADYVSVERRMGAVSIFFGKAPATRGGEKKLRTRLEIRYADDPFVRHFWANSRDFHARLKGFLASRSYGTEGVGVVVTAMEAEKDHSEWANFDVIAHSGNEATMDFFHLDPTVIARYAKLGGPGGLRFTPVVRVHTTAVQVCSLFDACEALVAEIEPTLREEADKE